MPAEGAPVGRAGVGLRPAAVALPPAVVGVGVDRRLQEEQQQRQRRRDDVIGGQRRQQRRDGGRPRQARIRQSGGQSRLSQYAI